MDSTGNNATFRGETEIHDKAMRVNVQRAGSHHSRVGELDAVAASGGMDPDLNESNESEPLLSNRKNSAGSGHSDHFAEDHFAGLPWYRRPSVSLLHVLMTC